MQFCKLQPCVGVDVEPTLSMLLTTTVTLTVTISGQLGTNCAVKYWFGTRSLSVSTPYNTCKFSTPSTNSMGAWSPDFRHKLKGAWPLLLSPSPGAIKKVWDSIAETAASTSNVFIRATGVRNKLNEHGWNEAVGSPLLVSPEVSKETFDLLHDHMTKHPDTDAILVTWGKLLYSLLYLELNCI